MTRPVVLLLDRSSFAEEAIPHAVAIARRLDAPVRIVLVHVPPPTLTTFDQVIIPPAEWDREFRQDEDAYLRSIADRLQRLGVTVVPVVLEGLVVPSIIDDVIANDAEVVVMTTHGRGGVSRFFLGSVADRLTREVHCPILLVRPGQAAARAAGDTVRVLVPLDGSPLAESTIDRVVHLFGRTEASLTCLQVVVQPSMVLPLAGEIAMPVVTIDRMVAATREYLDTVATQLRADGLTVHTIVRSGEMIVPEVLAVVDEQQPDIIALATRGHGGVERALFGSVADKLVRGAPVPVLVWNPPLGAHSRLLVGGRGAEARAPAMA